MRDTRFPGSTLIVTLAATAAVAAQAGVPRPAPTAPDAGRTVTLTGCLRSWDGSPTGIGRGDAAGPAAQFVLTNVEEPAPATSRVPVGTSGTTPTPPATASTVAHDTYVVQPADPQLALRPFLDQQVEVVGTLQVIPPHDATGTDARQGARPAPAVPQETGASVSGAAGAPPSQAAAKAPIQRVMLTTVKAVAKTCP